MHPRKTDAKLIKTAFKKQNTFWKTFRNLTVDIPKIFSEKRNKP
jgi:hypothetical protein